MVVTTVFAKNIPNRQQPKESLFSAILATLLPTTLVKINLFKTQLGSYNPGHNSLELYKILVQIRFTTSKRKVDI